MEDLGPPKVKYSECPICNSKMNIKCCGSPGYESSHCPICPLEYIGNGNYSFIIKIDDEKFDLEPGWWSGWKEFWNKVKEMKDNL